jgi:hypothetical protein
MGVLDMGAHDERMTRDSAADERVRLRGRRGAESYDLQGAHSYCVLLGFQSVLLLVCMSHGACCFVVVVAVSAH